MNELDIDFGGAGTQTVQTGTAPQTGVEQNPASNQEDVTNLGGDDVDDVTGKDGKETDGDDQNSSTGELSTGDTVEVDGVVYTVAENGDLVDSKGTIFKEAKDVDEWLKSIEVEDGSNSGEVDLASIQAAIGITVTDENGKLVEFTNDAAGVKSYVDSVIELRSNDIQQATMNRFYAENPLVKQFQDYVQLNGTPRGFGEIPDRSGIQLDKDNEAQLVAVIRMAANEFGNKSLNDNYIKYLRDSGGLYDEARTQLQALVEKDQAVRQDIQRRAQEQRDAEAQSIAEYWENVNKIISNRVVNGYKLPESFTKEVDGKKVVITLNDFYNYVSRPLPENEEGRRLTGYQRDLNNLTDEEYLHREMLDAWLMFTGGTYKDLIDMAVKEDKVRQLRIKSKEQRQVKSVKVIKNKTGKTDINDIVL